MVKVLSHQVGVSEWFGKDAHASKPSEAALFSESAGLNLGYRYAQITDGLSDLKGWGYVAGLNLLGDFAGLAGYRLFRHLGLRATIGQVLADEGLSALFTGSLRNPDNWSKLAKRDFVEGLFIRGGLIAGSLAFRKFNFLARSLMNLPLFVGLTYGFGKLGDRATGEQTVGSLGDHITSSLVIYIQGQTISAARHRLTKAVLDSPAQAKLPQQEPHSTAFQNLKFVRGGSLLAVGAFVKNGSSGLTNHSADQIIGLMAQRSTDDELVLRLDIPFEASPRLEQGLEQLQARGINLKTQSIPEMVETLEHWFDEAHDLTDEPGPRKVQHTFRWQSPKVGIDLTGEVSLSKGRDHQGILTFKMPANGSQDHPLASKPEYRTWAFARTLAGQEATPDIYQSRAAVVAADVRIQKRRAEAQREALRERIKPKKRRRAPRLRTYSKRTRTPSARPNLSGSQVRLSLQPWDDKVYSGKMWTYPQPDHSDALWPGLRAYSFPELAKPWYRLMKQWRNNQYQQAPKPGHSNKLLEKLLRAHVSDHDHGISKNALAKYQNNQGDTRPPSRYAQKALADVMGLDPEALYFDVGRRHLGEDINPEWLITSDGVMPMDTPWLIHTLRAIAQSYPDGEVNRDDVRYRVLTKINPPHAAKGFRAKDYMTQPYFISQTTGNTLYGQTISRWIYGNRSVSEESYQLISEAFGISIDELRSVSPSQRMAGKDKPKVIDPIANTLNKLQRLSDEYDVVISRDLLDEIHGWLLKVKQRELDHPPAWHHPRSIFTARKIVGKDSPAWKGELLHHLCQTRENEAVDSQFILRAARLCRGISKDNALDHGFKKYHLDKLERPGYAKPMRRENFLAICAQYGVDATKMADPYMKRTYPDVDWDSLNFPGNRVPYMEPEDIGWMFKYHDQGPSLGEWLRRWRLGQGLRRQELADRLGMHIDSIRDYEYNNVFPDRPNLEKIAEKTGTTAEELLKLKDGSDNGFDPKHIVEFNPKRLNKKKQPDFDAQAEQLGLKKREFANLLHQAHSPDIGLHLLKTSDKEALYIYHPNDYRALTNYEILGYRSFGEALRLRRLQMSNSKRIIDLASQMHLGYVRLIHIENNRLRPLDEDLPRMAEHYGIDYDELVRLRDETYDAEGNLKQPYGKVEGLPGWELKKELSERLTAITPRGDMFTDKQVRRDLRLLEILRRTNWGEGLLDPRDQKRAIDYAKKMALQGSPAVAQKGVGVLITAARDCEDGALRQSFIQALGEVGQRGSTTISKQALLSLTKDHLVKASDEIQQTAARNQLASAADGTLGHFDIMTLSTLGTHAVSHTQADVALLGVNILARVAESPFEGRLTFRAVRGLRHGGLRHPDKHVSEASHAALDKVFGIKRFKHLRRKTEGYKNKTVKNKT